MQIDNLDQICYYVDYVSHFSYFSWVSEFLGEVKSLNSHFGEREGHKSVSRKETSLYLGSLLGRGS